ncbi:hypothetical protein LX32DRAFT_723693 [Colletotrichum zoysiae]|uniref:HNH nuclease domain-containing protein n=1 Tax=Colletotrichum zoysiae TaxID=1216348 RepID=A0AAD9HW35_9PEZI|nr:hypothetical protein LX32DRAFT_723693 [Colletotrichum zoysiae]
MEAAPDPAGIEAKISWIQAEMRDFFEDEQAHHPTAADKATLEAFLTSTKTCIARPGEVEYLDDHDAKLALVSQVGASVPGMQGAAFWSALWTMPAGDVGKLLGELRTRSGPEKIRLCDPLERAVKRRLPQLIRIFRGLYERDPYGDGLAAMDDNAGSERNEIERFIALQRDGNKCVIEDIGYPKVCHIFPLASIEQRYQRITKACLDELQSLWGRERALRLADKLFNSGAGQTAVVDTAANMICLGATLRKWWYMGLFALEPMEKPQPLDAAGSAQGAASQQRWGIRLRFHWLKRTDIPDLNAAVDFSEDPVPKMQEPEGRCMIFNATTCRPTESGQVFTVTADDPDKLPDYDILLLQWDLLRIWRLAGGADPAVCYPFDSDDGGEDSQPTGSTRFYG